MISREVLQSVQDVLDLAGRCTVPSRREVGPAARKSFHREDWCVARFVLRQVEAGIYTFPITIERPTQDPPDFLLSIAGAPAIALEVRDAGAEGYQEAATAQTRGPAGTFQEGGNVVPPGGELSGKGWAGNAQAREWARHIDAAVAVKTSGLPRQPLAARYELLLYDQTLTDADPVQAASLVQPLPHAQMPNGSRSFDRVSVVSDSDLLLDVYGARRLLRRGRSEPVNPTAP